MTPHESALDAVGNLVDAILERLEFDRFLSRVKLRFDYTWTPLPHERTDGSAERAPRHLTVVLDRVLDFRFHFDLPEPVLLDPLHLGWSHTEVALATIDWPDLPAARSGWHWLSLLWEGETRVDVSFSGLTIEFDEVAPDRS